MKSREAKTVSEGNLITSDIVGLWRLRRRWQWRCGDYRLRSFYVHLLASGVFSYLGELTKNAKVEFILNGYGTWAISEHSLEYVRRSPSRVKGAAIVAVRKLGCVVDRVPFLSCEEKEFGGYFVRANLPRSRITRRQRHALLYARDELGQNMTLLEDRQGDGRPANWFSRVKIAYRETYHSKSSDEATETGTEDSWEFVVGTNQSLPGIEYAVIGMREGGYKRIRISPSLGYPSGEQDMSIEIVLKRVLTKGVAVIN